MTPRRRRADRPQRSRRGRRHLVLVRRRQLRHPRRRRRDRAAERDDARGDLRSRRSRRSTAELLGERAARVRTQRAARARARHRARSPLGSPRRESRRGSAPRRRARRTDGTRHPAARRPRRREALRRQQRRAAAVPARGRSASARMPSMCASTSARCTRSTSPRSAGRCRKYGVAGLLGSYNRLNGDVRLPVPLPSPAPARAVGLPRRHGPGLPLRRARCRGRTAPPASTSRVSTSSPAAPKRWSPRPIDELLAGVGEHVRAAAAQVGLVAATGVADPIGARHCPRPRARRARRDRRRGAAAQRQTLPLAAGTRIALIGGGRDRSPTRRRRRRERHPDGRPDPRPRPTSSRRRASASSRPRPGLPTSRCRRSPRAEGVELSAVIRDDAGERALSLDDGRAARERRRPWRGMERGAHRRPASSTPARA